MTALAQAAAQGFGAEQRTGAAILLLCVIVGVALALMRSKSG